MKGLFWITGAVVALTACGGGGGGKSGLGSGDIFPDQFKDNNFSCSGTAANGTSQGRQYTLVASISSQPLQLNGETRQMQASLYDQSLSGGVSGSAYNYSQGYGTSGIGQSQPAEARYFQSNNQIVLTPTNRNGTTSTWNGKLTIWALNNSGEFNGQLNGVQVRIPNMSCTQSGRTFGSGGQIGTTGMIPQFLTCRDSQYTASVSNGTMTLSRTGGTQETYTLITNGQAFAGQSTQTYSVQGRSGVGGSGTATISQSTIGSTVTSGSFGGNYVLRLSNVYYQNQPLNNSLTCN